jgi:hypothetical protein
LTQNWRVCCEPHWCVAIECLIEAAEGRSIMMRARIAMMRALRGCGVRRLTGLSGDRLVLGFVAGSSLTPGAL